MGQIFGNPIRESDLTEEDHRDVALEQVDTQTRRHAPSPSPKKTFY